MTRVKVVDVDVSRRRISLSIKRVSEEERELPEAEITAETTEEISAEVAPEPSEETAEVLEDAVFRADEAEPEVLEAIVEPEPEAPEEAAMTVRSEAELEVPAPAPEAEEAPEDEGDITLEAIMADLKRREGRQ
jgi:hypothetical protein